MYEAQKLDLNILIKELVTELKLDSKFEVQIPQLLPVLTTPREVLTQVYSNLFNNVMKFNNSAKINLEITYVKNNERVIFCVADVTSSSQSDVTMLTASDTNEVQDALFEGTGAGLSIAKKLVEFDKVAFILGPGCGSPQVTLAPLLRSSGVLAMLSSSATQGLFELSGGNYFAAIQECGRDTVCAKRFLKENYAFDERNVFGNSLTLRTIRNGQFVRNVP